MRLNDALENEKKRQESESWNKIYLHKDGKFFHAYEWSAWLIKAFVCTEEFQKERGDSKMLSAFLYKTKNTEYIILGFPIESYSKYIPQYVNATPLEKDDILIEIEFPFDLSITTYDELSTHFNEWRTSCEIKESKKQQRAEAIRENNAEALSKSGIFHILSQVLSYPVEKSTPSDNINFISKLKQQIAALL